MNPGYDSGRRMILIKINYVRYRSSPSMLIQIKSAVGFQTLFLSYR